MVTLVACGGSPAVSPRAAESPVAAEQNWKVPPPKLRFDWPSDLRLAVTSTQDLLQTISGEGQPIDGFTQRQLERGRSSTQPATAPDIELLVPR